MSTLPGAPIATPLRAGALLLLLLAGGAAPRRATAAEEPAAPPGYAPDHACASCHAEIQESLRASGKSRSLHRPAPDDPEHAVEDLAATLFHPLSQRYYEMRRSGDGYLFRRYQIDPQGEPINVVERPVDWILGSGTHARVYLFRTPTGELNQLPVAWYAESGAWGMAPGYDRADHDGLTRRLEPSCLFCHNAYPASGAGEGSPGALAPPRDLQQGIGCQRCHGPGAEHAALAGAGAGPEAVRRSIVNPARLAPPARDDVCDQCHLQPSVEIAAVPVFGSGPHSYRPGEALTDHLVPIEVEVVGADPAKRFDVNHHGYRLRQSRCFEASGGDLACTSCHDPHRPVPPAERAEHYRRACLGCHSEGDWQAVGGGEHPAAEGADCVACHMPRRRTQDMVQVVTTDHRIARRPDALATAARRETPRVVGSTAPYFADRAPAGASAELYSLLALLAVSPSQDAAALVAERLAAEPSDSPEPYQQLLEGQLKTRLFAAAEKTARRLLEARPDDSRAIAGLAVALAGTGRATEAIERARDAVRLDPGRAEHVLNLGLLELSDGDGERAVARLERAAELRPDLASVWIFLADARIRLDRLGPAADALRRGLEIDPGHARSYLALGQVLAASGDRAEALRYLRHGHALTGDRLIGEEIEKLSAAE